MSSIAPARPLHLPSRLSEEDARDIAVEAWLYAYPLVLMEIARRTLTNVAAPLPDGQAPMNQFSHTASLPDADTQAAWPVPGMLPSQLWFDVSRDPLFLQLPDSNGRFYVMQMIDMWGDTFASLGARTTGTADQLIVLAPTGWIGQLPRNARLVRTPTSQGLVVCHIQAAGPADHSSVHKFQLALRAGPLSTLGRVAARPRPQLNLAWDMHHAPRQQVAKMDAKTFFALFCELAGPNPPHANDYPVLERMERLGIRPGLPFSPNFLSRASLDALDDAAPAALRRIGEGAPQSDYFVNGWRYSRAAIASYGTDYLARAIALHRGFDTSPREDAIVAEARVDGHGEALSSDRRYRIRFDRWGLPPARAGWSLALYDERGRFAHNAINRYALGDSHPLSFAEDGSLEFRLSRVASGENDSNWLPLPAQGPFTLRLHLAWPTQDALDQRWTPPAVSVVE